MPQYQTGHCFLCEGKSDQLLLRVMANQETGELQCAYLCPVCRHQLDWMITDGEVSALRNQSTKKLASTPRYLLTGGKN